MSQNLEDIARLAGVSRSTVSRVINNHPNVSQRTRDKVLRVIEEQHFHPNPAARALVTRQTQTISLVIPVAVADTFADPFYSILIQGVVSTANQHDYAVLLWVGDAADAEERFSQRILNHSLFDGVLIAAALDDDPLIPLLAEAHFPLMVIGRFLQKSLNYVDVDNLGGARLATSHLLKLGRRRIGMITGPSRSPAARMRVGGYREALRDAGCDIDDNIIVEGAYNEASGYAAMKRLLDCGVDSVFAASDMMAAGAIHAIQDSGRRVPEDISVVGFDDMPVATKMCPQLTTVRQDVHQLGSAAVQALIDVLQQRETVPYQRSLPTRLVIRESCGA